eukprot:TRINITY_DN1091_c0_g1_i10.p1 TRINITY_DN1091_c0_g1~~TRINITY_DN1091_c0_g1_i10.p1  ORF type:complete len:101 (+),score=0.20 TRINITY_DN1091_c0_g1_i10:156-458(+)
MDPNDGIWDRHHMYEWSSGSNAYQCGPKSYLNSSLLCERDPRYWTASVDTLTCFPLKNTEEVCNNNGSIECCFSSAYEDFPCHLKAKDCSSWWLEPTASQ